MPFTTGLDFSHLKYVLFPKVPILPKYFNTMLTSAFSFLHFPSTANNLLKHLTTEFLNMQGNLNNYNIAVCLIIFYTINLESIKSGQVNREQVPAPVHNFHG